MSTITVSAPGKLMLLGEHAVVYDRACIVTAVGQRMYATVEFVSDPVLVLDAKDVLADIYTKPIGELGIGEIPKGAKFVEYAVRNFIEKYPLSGGVKITIRSEFSSQFGFGSSSASTVCVMKGLSELSGIQISNKRLFEYCYQTVLDIQKAGSGFDVAAAIYGGTIYFVNAGKIIDPLAIDTLPLVIGYTGVKTDTVTVMNSVSDRMATKPVETRQIFTAIQEIVQKAKSEIVVNDWRTLGQQMNEDQRLLKLLGVSSDKLDSMISAALDAGAYGAKLSGAGVGDCMIALVSEDKRKAVAAAITKVGGQVIDIPTNVEGVRVEKN